MSYVFCLQLNFLRREFIGLYSSKMLNLKHLASHAYRQYELVTCVNMLEPWEKKLINGFFLVMLFLVLFSSFMYLPNYMQTLMQFVTPPNWHNSPDSAAYVAQKMTRS